MQLYFFAQTIVTGRSMTPDFSSFTELEVRRRAVVNAGNNRPPIFSLISRDFRPQGKKKPEIATVIAPYQATSKEQLSLSRGQLIMIRKKTTSGWWEGESHVRDSRSS